MSHIVARVVFALSVFCQVSSASAEWQQPSVERQEIAVTLLPSDHLLIGESTITFAADLHRVILKLSPTAHIESVSTSGAKSPFTFADGTLSLDIPSSAGPGAISVTVAYRAVFNDPLPQHPGSSEYPTYGVNGSISTLGTFLGEGAGWYPATSGTPRHRTVRITAPAGIEALTAGRRVSRVTVGGFSHSSWEESRPVGGLTLCAGPYRIEERRVAGVDLYTYFYPDNASLSSRYLAAAARYIALYSDLFGPYPFEKFAVVENFLPTGYGFPSFTLLGSSIIRLPFIIDTSFPHEIAHSWWGNAIQVDQSEGNWSEALVTYLADYLLKERRSSAEGRDYRMQILTDYAGLVTPDNDFPLSGFISRIDPASRAIGYGKGAMIFHMIRSEIGDRAFFGALREICRERLYRSASWSDFVRAFSRSSGRDLSSFMKQWLTRTGGPRLALSKVTRRREGPDWTVSGTVMQSPPLYALLLQLRLETDGQPVRELLQVTGGMTAFTISSPSEPRQLSLDPDSEVFRVLAKDEIPVTVNSIKASKQLLGVMTEECQARVETFRLLLESLGQGRAAVIGEDQLDATRIQGHDLLFCGVPKQRSLLPRLPAGIALHGKEFSVQDDVMKAPDGLLFLVQQHPASSERVAALFQPLSEAAAEQYAPKITHYGKYGSLTFTRGAIRHKSTIMPTAGATSVRF
ncbi:MAG: M1 family peptidase [Desulfuromonadales bacterium]|nr:M1 family peptidase [Desulfuromonadales bacterium]